MTDRPACADHRHPEWWTAEVNEHTSIADVREQRIAAANVCNTICPIKDACLASAEAARKQPSPKGPGDPDAPILRPVGVLGGMFYDCSKRRPVPVGDSPPTADPELRRNDNYKWEARETDGRFVRVAGEFTVHGVAAGYARHRRLGEPSCQPCRDAYNAQRAAYKAERKARIKAQARVAA